MQSKSYSIFGGHGSKSGIEHAAEVIFTICGFFAVLAVASISIYMLTSGTPALFKVEFWIFYLVLSGNQMRPFPALAFYMLS